jgi:hypothetical protein
MVSKMSGHPPQRFFDPEETPSFTLYKEGLLYKAKNGHTGQTQFLGPDAATVIQSALNGLTAGRTWKEKVVFKGISTILAQINVPSYTILEGGRFEAGASMDSVSDITDKHDIEIRNMSIDGNYPFFTSRGINAFGTTTEKIKVENVFIQDAYPNYISIRGTNLQVNNNYLIDTTDATGDVVGIYVGVPGEEYATGRRSKNNLISHNQLYNIYGDGISINSYKATVAENFIDGGGRGLSTAGCIDVWGKCDGSIVALNNLINKDSGAASISCGVVVWRDQAPEPDLLCDKVLIHDNLVSGMGSSGIAVYSAPGNMHTNISIIDNIISGTLLQWASGGDITLYYCDSSVVTGNELYSATPMWLEGISGTNIIENNKGYVTENSGTVTISAESGSFAHGLVSTAIKVFLTPSGSATAMYMGALGWYPSGSTGVWVVQTGSDVVPVNWDARVY